MTRSVELEAEGLTKKFGLRTIFSKISFTARAGERVAITGRNGSGKSTLMKLLAGVAERSAGSVRYRIDGRDLRDDEQLSTLGFVSPYLQLYNEFTAWEHVVMLQRMRGVELDEELAVALFRRFGIDHRMHDELRTYSSGMLQRVKYICALVHSPAFLLLDEPMANFDDDAIGVVREIVIERSPSSVILLATNDAPDLSLATSILSVETGALRYV